MVPKSIDNADTSTDTERVLGFSKLGESGKSTCQDERNGREENLVRRKFILPTYVSIQQRFLLSNGRDAEIRLLLAH